MALYLQCELKILNQNGFLLDKALIMNIFLFISKHFFIDLLVISGIMYFMSLFSIADYNFADAALTFSYDSILRFFFLAGFVASFLYLFVKYIIFDVMSSFLVDNFSYLALRDFGVYPETSKLTKSFFITGTAFSIICFIFKLNMMKDAHYAVSFDATATTLLLFAFGVALIIKYLFRLQSIKLKDIDASSEFWDDRKLSDELKQHDFFKDNQKDNTQQIREKRENRRQRKNLLSN